MLQSLVYPWVMKAVVLIVMVTVFLMLMRLLFAYADPNPFGAIGRFAFKLKKATDGLVHPFVSLLARLRINTKIAPLLTVLSACVIGFFFLDLVSKVFVAIDGVTEAAMQFSIVRVVGSLLSGFLSIYSLLIVIRIVFSWVMSYGNPLLKFLIRVTEPILGPFRRIIPTIGMFDLSPLIVLLLISFLQSAVAGVLLSNR